MNRKRRINGRTPRDDVNGRNRNSGSPVECPDRLLRGDPNGQNA